MLKGKSTKISVTCQTCGKEFYTKPSRIKAGKGKYCSSVCYFKKEREKSDLKPRPKTLARECCVCKKVFFVNPLILKKRPAKFCSKLCQATPLSLEDRFFKHVGKKRDDGCIFWSGPKSSGGYGTIGFDGRPDLTASRVSYELFVGQIPKGLFVLHHCDNPPCVNPVHLFLGSISDNSIDCVKKGRHVHGSRSHFAKLTNDKVREMRERYAMGGASIEQLAREYGISGCNAGKIIRRLAWKHVL